MSCGDGQGSHADQVTSVAEDADLLAREIRDLTSILQVLSVAKGDDASDASFD
jgi:hypothetical protein